jgi:hypothetical protein
LQTGAALLRLQQLPQKVLHFALGQKRFVLTHEK